MIEKKILPYELLVRWTNGAVAGAHVGYIEQIVEDGTVLKSTELPVMPVDIGQGKGFPLADILNQVSADAVIAASVAQAAQKVAEDAKATAGAALEATKAELASAQAEIAVYKLNAEQAKAVAPDVMP